jgi:hypothetical protein
MLVGVHGCYVREQFAFLIGMDQDYHSYPNILAYCQVTQIAGGSIIAEAAVTGSCRDQTDTFG